MAELHAPDITAAKRRGCRTPPVKGFLSINLTLSPGLRERAHACAAGQGGQPLTLIARPDGWGCQD